MLVQTKTRRKFICLKSSQHIKRPNTANDRHTENSHSDEKTKREASADKSSTIISCESYIRILICEYKSNVELNSILVEIFIPIIIYVSLILLRLLYIHYLCYKMLYIYAYNIYCFIMPIKKKF